ncbi:Cys-tRNA(Pro) deacylase YbaK [Streptomyces venezuelae]|nr:Cys-tRNA(Pro) deacylase YbaK [Streptomyces venezuelae]
MSLLLTFVLMTRESPRTGENGKGSCRFCNTGRMTEDDDRIDAVLNEVGPRLRRVRRDRGVTLAELSAATGISVSTLSRLESGQRKPSLELLLPLARAHQVPLDELVGAPAVGDPRVKARPIVRHGRTMYPLTRQPGGLQAYKVIQEKPTETPNPVSTRGTSGCTCSPGSCGSSSVSTTSSSPQGRPRSSTRVSRTGSARRPKGRWSS